MQMTIDCQECDETLYISHGGENPFRDEAYCESCQIQYAVTRDWEEYELTEDAMMAFKTGREELNTSVLELVETVDDGYEAPWAETLRSDDQFSALAAVATGESPAIAIEVEQKQRLSGQEWLTLKLYEKCPVCYKTHPMRTQDEDLSPVGGAHYTYGYEDTVLVCYCGEELGRLHGDIEQSWSCSSCDREYQRSVVTTADEC